MLKCSPSARDASSCGEVRRAARYLELVEGVGELHAVVFGGPAHQHHRGQAGNRAFAEQVLFVADVLA
jgi:hypothetical protein